MHILCYDKINSVCQMAVYAFERRWCDGKNPQGERVLKLNNGLKLTSSPYLGKGD